MAGLLSKLYQRKEELGIARRDGDGRWRIEDRESKIED
jgi:hypothetical protein